MSVGRLLIRDKCVCSVVAATFVAHNLPDFLVYCCFSGAALD